MKRGMRDRSYTIHVTRYLCTCLRVYLCTCLAPPFAHLLICVYNRRTFHLELMDREAPHPRPLPNYLVRGEGWMPGAP